MAGYAYSFKCIIVGDTGVGKSSILLQFTDGKFTDYHDLTIGVEFGTKIIDIDSRAIRIEIWDTAGQEYFRSITRSYYRNAAAVLLVYDVTRQTSFDVLHGWLDEVRVMTRNPKIILIGNKADRTDQRVVSWEQGNDFATKNNMLFIETSAKTGINIDNVFRAAGKQILKKIYHDKLDLTDESHGIKVGFPERVSMVRAYGQDIDENKKTSLCCYV
jgi:Ras-related protein Rab-2A